MEEKKATQVTGCKQCEKGLSTTQKGLLILGFYILATSVYGTFKLLQLLNSLF
jgi:hypothetical protein